MAANAAKVKQLVEQDPELRQALAELEKSPPRKPRPIGWLRRANGRCDRRYSASIANKGGCNCSVPASAAMTSAIASVETTMPTQAKMLASGLPGSDGGLVRRRRRVTASFP